MKTYSIIALLFISLTQCVAVAAKAENWGKLTNGVQMAISVKGGETNIGPNQPVVLMLCFKAVSTNELPILDRQNEIESDDTYSFTVISPSGKDVSPSAKPRFIPGSGSSKILGPSPIAFEYNLSARCNFGEVGNYTIVAKKEMLSRRSGTVFTVVSSTLTINVGSAQNQSLP